MFAYLIKAKDIILDILFPPICINCHTTLNNTEHTRNNAENYLCQNCYSTIKLNTSLFCPFCRARLADNKKTCRHSKKNFPYLYFLAAAGNYDNPILQDLIHYLKYRKFENLAPILGEIVVKYIENCKLKIENYIIIPIPLHFWREKARGFNQSKLLAKYIAKNLNLQIVDGLKRVKNNQPQAKSRNSEERNKNVEGIFKIVNPELIRGRNIILFDDVYTSGATMNEAVKILKQNGAKKIIALVIAKT